jgi:hypothetical protein
MNSLKKPRKKRRADPTNETTTKHAAVPSHPMNVLPVGSNMSTARAIRLRELAPASAHLDTPTVWDQQSSFQLPIYIKTSFKHDHYGPITALAVLVYVDDGRADSITVRRNEFEKFKMFPGKSSAYRAAFVHRIFHIEPSNTPLSLLLDEWFSSFNVSLRYLGNTCATGFAGWTVDEHPKLTMGMVMRDIGFENHFELQGKLPVVVLDQGDRKVTEECFARDALLTRCRLECNEVECCNECGWEADDTYYECKHGQQHMNVKAREQKAEEDRQARKKRKKPSPTDQGDDDIPCDTATNTNEIKEIMTAWDRRIRFLDITTKTYMDKIKQQVTSVVDKIISLNLNSRNRMRFIGYQRMRTLVVESDVTECMKHLEFVQELGLRSIGDFHPRFLYTRFKVKNIDSVPIYNRHLFKSSNLIVLPVDPMFANTINPPSTHKLLKV